MPMLEGKKLLITGVINRESIAFEVARQAQEAAREDGVAYGFGPEQVRAHGFGAAPVIEILVADKGGALVGHTVTYKGYDIRVGQPNLVPGARPNHAPP